MFLIPEITDYDMINMPDDTNIEIVKKEDSKHKKTP
jgi:hypothetical protein